MNPKLYDYLEEVNFKEKSKEEIVSFLKKYNIDRLKSVELLGDIIMASFLVGESLALTTFKKSFLYCLQLSELEVREEKFKIAIKKHNREIRRIVKNDFDRYSPFFLKKEIDHFNKFLTKGVDYIYTGENLKFLVQSEFFLLITT